MNQKGFLVIITTALFFSGCVPAIMVKSIYQDPQFTFGEISEQKRLTYFVKEDISIREFKRTFRKDYTDSVNFFHSFRKEVADSISRILKCQVLEIEDPRDLPVMSSLAEDSISPSEDYVLYIKHIDIGNTVEWSGGSYTSDPAGVVNPGAPVAVGPPGASGMNMSPMTRSEKCVVTITTELWDSNKRRSVLEYSAIGEAEVNLLTSALKLAVGRSIQKTLQYLVDGQTEVK